MLDMVKLKLRAFLSRLRWPASTPRCRRQRRPAKPAVVVRQFGRPNPNIDDDADDAAESMAKPNTSKSAVVQLRLATFNAAMFSMAPAVSADHDIRCKSANDRPKGILKQQSLGKSKLRVSINLPDNEISVERTKQLRERAPSQCYYGFGSPRSHCGAERSMLDVLREVGADVIALQNVKAEEEKAMRPLSDLAEGLGMKFVFAESWAPEYGNAILSKWPIKHWMVQKIFDDTDFRNVLKATIEIPRVGEVNFHCTHLDHLDENWRMKQINSILRSRDGPHILAGGLNSLDETDYSAERWADIAKYYEEIGKPKPKVEVMKYLKGKQYVDAKHFAGECEAVVILAKGQDVQGTCKYGTRVDYILASPYSPYKFVPGSYGVLSSKGTSDHHIVKVDVTVDRADDENGGRRRRHPKQRVVKMDKASSRGIWGTS
ncbi:uncharacterized protein LOC109708617 [Ananas comosus]|uniref:Uncharacterized protein LOC109708617 n=1 Tax=Ananas comosus TaxID=4615 RepID=A0A6P5EXU1_ANACO|nr:uncharacterized protein LOC109708617 [Ananas comosus]